MLNLWALLCTFSCLMASGVFANIILMGNNVTLSFDDIEASFGRPVKGSGERGTLFLATPLDACSPLTNISIEDSINSPYVLIIRGGCGFEDKVRRAQSAGFKAAIVYNNEDSDLVAMAGDSAGIHIHAVFVSKSSGLKLRKYVGVTEMEASHKTRTPTSFPCSRFPWDEQSTSESHAKPYIYSSFRRQLHFSNMCYMP